MDLDEHPARQRSANEPVGSASHECESGFVPEHSAKPVYGERAFVTILDPNGTVTVADANVLALATKRSNKSQLLYATHLTVEIPSKQAKLDVKLLADDQEIASKCLTPRMEGKASVAGSYLGKPAEGRTIVEMFNLFPLFSAAYGGMIPPAPVGGVTSIVQ